VQCYANVMLPKLSWRRHIEVSIWFQLLVRNAKISITASQIRGIQTSKGRGALTAQGIMAAGTMNISIPANCAELDLLAMGVERGPTKASHIFEIMESVGWARFTCPTSVIALMLMLGR
jgi:hypothetical protein